MIIRFPISMLIFPYSYPIKFHGILHVVYHDTLINFVKDERILWVTLHLFTIFSFKNNNVSINSALGRSPFYTFYRDTYHKYFSRNLPKVLLLYNKMKGAKSSAPRQIIWNRLSELSTLNVYIQRYSTTNKHGNINKCSS